MSILNVYLEERFVKFNDEYYSLVYGDAFWERYLAVFESINVVARIEEVSKIQDVKSGYNKINVDNINFIQLPYYHGVLSGLFKLPYTLIRLAGISVSGEYHLLRLPGPISMIAGLCLSILPNKIISVELVGDPYDVFSTGIGGGLSKLLRFVFTRTTKYIVRKAIAVSYVTEFTLQKRYAANLNAYTTHYSSIDLDNSVFNDKNIKVNIDKENFKILLVGSMEQRYKGFDLVVEAISILEFKSKVNLIVVGDGFYKDEIIEQVRLRGLTNQVAFYGKLSRENVFRLMEKADLFIMPSRAEGLPRALIEAMATGLPAIGSDVGGIPELINTDYIFESENFTRLSELIEKIYYHDDISGVSKANFIKAHEYKNDILQKRREQFYFYIKSQGTV